MARNTSSTINTLDIIDNLAGGEKRRYFYRNPTTQERQGYINMSFRRKGKKVKMDQAGARLRYGLKILTGFREGDFTRDVDGKEQVYASDPKSPNYLDTWKEEQEKGASDLIMLLAAHVFEGSAEIVDEDDEDNETEPGEASWDDAPGNSETTSQQ